VPKTLEQNLEFRRQIIIEGSKSRDNARQIWCACARDPLFFINTFAWAYDPRQAATVVPFITWDFQDWAICRLNQSIEQGRDILIEKSRDMGASWICLLTFLWRWHFRDMQSFMVLSRKEDLVDKTGDPDCLFWKLDFIIKNEPKWMLPSFDAETDRNKLMIVNSETGSTITGDSTTGDVARGGRKTAILLDEFASVEEGESVLNATADATDCRVFNSTPKGTANAFYSQRQKLMEQRQVMRLHWSIHPTKAANIYNDPETGKLRSPWYDKQCKRRHPMEIAQELDIDYLGSEYTFFDARMIDEIQKNYVRDPARSCDLEFDKDSAEPVGFVDVEHGPLKLWIGPDDKREDGYIIGCDIATGTGASNSCLSICSLKTNEKVAEFATPRMRPDQVARYAVALARMFRNKDGVSALLIWEANGPGRSFGDQVIQLGYRHVYYRTREQALSKKTSDVPGWFSTVESKNALLSEYRRALIDKQFINRSYYATEEMRAYVYRPGGVVAHSSSFAKSDPTGARDNHGDRVIADALCWHGMRSTDVVEKEPEREIDPTSFMARRLEREREQKAVSSY